MRPLAVKSRGSGFIGTHLGIVIVLLFLGGRAIAAQVSMKIALLPFENVSGSVKSLRIIMPIVEQALREKGYGIISRKRLEPLLFRHRIRNTGMLSLRQLDALRQEFDVGLAMVGSVDLFHDSEENPQWGLSSRILSTRDATILWAEVAGLTGNEFTRILGFGTIRSNVKLAREVVKVLLRGLPTAGVRFTVPDSKRSAILRLFKLRPGYRSPILDSDPPKRVAVLPFENASERRGAGRILTDIFNTALFHHGRFQVIQQGEVRESLIAPRAAPYGAIDFETLGGLRKRIGVDAVIVGTVYAYSEGLREGATNLPEIFLDARMIHAESGRILWFVNHARSGEDYQIALDFGIIRSIVPLALRVIQEMLETL